jgi:ankyrin repeat protein
MINFKELFHSKNENDLLKLFTYKLNNITNEELKLFQNYKDEIGNTLLHHAYYNNCLKLSKLLFDNMIGVNIKNNEGNVIEFSESNDFSESSELSERLNDLHKSIQSETDIFSANTTIQNLSEHIIKKKIKFTRHKTDKYLKNGKDLIKYIQSINQESPSIVRIASIYNLNLNKPNDILLAKYKQTGLFDYINTKFPNLKQNDKIKLLKHNLTKNVLDKISAINIKKKIMRCFKSIKNEL